MKKAKLLFSMALAFVMVMCLSAAVFAAEFVNPKAGVIPDQTAKNAHQTGEKGVAGTLVKNQGTWAGQTVHGNYQNNTNACGSCHKTHTANKDSAALLFAATEVDACYACHDGTMAPDLGASCAAGVFNGQDSTTGKSQHSVASGAIMNQAPGGNFTATTGAWSEALTCDSCHSPHGSDSYALLNTNLGMGTTDPNNASVGKFVDKPATAIVDNSGAAPAKVAAGQYDASPKYVLAWITVDSTKAPWTSGWGKDLIDNGYKDPSTGNYIAGTKVVIGQKVLMTYWLNPNPGSDGKYSYTLVTPLWNQATISGTDAAKFQQANSSTFVVDYKHGVAYGTDAVTNLTTTLSFSMPIGISVQAYKAIPTGGLVAETFNKGFFDSGYINFNQGSGFQYSLFCGQCHPDYAQFSRSNNDIQGPGKYHAGRSHSTVSDSYSCTRCHFAHGTDPSVMRDATGSHAVATNNVFTGDLPPVSGKTKSDGTTFTDASAITYMTDTNPSSSTLRYPGMASCFSCHGGTDVTGASHAMGSVSNQVTLKEWNKSIVDKPTDEFFIDYARYTGLPVGKVPFKTGQGLPAGVPY